MKTNIFNFSRNDINELYYNLMLKYNLRTDEIDNIPFFEIQILNKI